MASEETPENNSILHTAMKVARIYYQSHLKDPEAKTYTESRQLTPSALYKFQIGYAPDDWRGLVDHFSTKKVRDAAKELSLIATMRDSNRLIDFFRGRLMFPIKNPDGVLVGYAGRLLEAKEGTPKYINTAETELFQKGDVLYGMFENKASIIANREAMLVEGYMDVITMASNGVTDGLAPMGTSLTTNQLSLILKSGVTRLILALDGDNAGHRATVRTIDVILDQYNPLLDIRIAVFPDGHDPDSYIREEGLDAFHAVRSAAVSLGDYIHQVCVTDLRHDSIDDSALYLTRMGNYVSRAYGPLYTTLIDHAQAYSKLDRAQLIELLPSPRALSENLNWDATTALAARWLVNDLPLQKDIAAKLAGITLTALGMDELASLAKQFQSGEEPTGKLHQYAKAHGPLDHSEIKELRGNWSSWMKRAALEEGMKGISENPYNATARQTMWHALTMR
jgi:DNA primase